MIRTWLHRLYRKVAPQVSDQSLPSPEGLAAESAAQRAYSGRFRSHLEWLQCAADVETAPTPLSYFPIGKNIRWIGTALYRNVKRNKRTVITAGNPREEERRRYQGCPAWRPWLWSRIPRAQLHDVDREVDDPGLSWPTYFQDLTHSTNGCRPIQSSRPTRGRGTKERVLRMAACTDYAFRLNEHMAGMLDDWKDRSAWDDNEPKIGIHLRRGDAASEDLAKQNRPFYPLEQYLQDADTRCERYGIRTIYLSTESEAEIERAHRWASSSGEEKKRPCHTWPCQPRARLIRWE